MKFGALVYLVLNVFIRATQRRLSHSQNNFSEVYVRRMSIWVEVG